MTPSDDADDAVFTLGDDWIDLDAFDLLHDEMDDVMLLLERVANTRDRKAFTKPELQEMWREVDDVLIKWKARTK